MLYELIGIVKKEEEADFYNKYGNRFTNFVYSNGAAKIIIPEENEREIRNLKKGWGFIEA